MTDETEAEEAAEEPAADDESPAEEPAPEAEQSDDGTLEEGDFVRLAFTIRTVEEGRVVDTSDPEVAEESDIDTEEHTFEPRVVVLGDDQVFSQVEAALLEASVGDGGSVTIPAAEAFGEYDPDDLRTVSADRIPEDQRYPGAHVDLDGEHGHVQTIVGGRARVDFNHPLAGDDLEYEYEVLEVVEDRLERARSIFQTSFDVVPEMEIAVDEVEEEVTVEPDEDDEDAEPTTEIQTVEKETLYVESDPQLQYNQQWLFSKQQVANRLIDHLGVDRVVIREIIEGGAGGIGGLDMADIQAAAGDEEAVAEEVEEVVEDLDIDEDDTEE